MPSNARLYNAVQILVGARTVYRRIQASLPSVHTDHPLVLDVGGGTAFLRTALPASAAYVCLDIDPLKLRQASLRKGAGALLLANATCPPLMSGCADIIVCVAVSHHLTDQQLQEVLAEVERLLKDQGSLLFLDAIWTPRRALSKLLWRYDQGKYPRTPEALLGFLSQRFFTAHLEHFRVYHEYLLFAGKKTDRKLCP